MTRQPVARAWLSAASSELLILLLYYVLELGRGILEKLVTVRWKKLDIVARRRVGNSIVWNV